MNNMIKIHFQIYLAFPTIKIEFSKVYMRIFIEMGVEIGFLVIF